jgi:hypothetical protein
MSDDGTPPGDPIRDEAAESDVSERSLAEHLVKLAKATAAVGFATSRAAIVRRLIEDSLRYNGLSSAEIFTAAYGDREGRDYWSAWMARKVSAYEFARLLATHLIDEAKELTAGGEGATDFCFQPTIHRILQCLSSALGKRIWLTSDGTPPSFTDVDAKGIAKHGFRHIHVDPREAVTWMLGDPASRDFVPKAMGRFAREQFTKGGDRSVDIPKAEGCPPDGKRGDTKASDKPIGQQRRKSSKKLNAAIAWLTKYFPDKNYEGRPNKEIMAMMQKDGFNISERTLKSAIAIIRTSGQNQAK